VNTSVQNEFDLLEQQRAEIVELIKNLPKEKFNHSPAEGKWSISQILTHILTAEGLSIGYMKKKAKGIAQLQDAGVLAEMRFLLLKISQRIPSLKFKAPRLVVENTPPALPKQQLLQQWEAQRNDLKTFLEGIDEKYSRRVIFKHPVAGRFSASQAVAFFREHIIHHLPQIKRLL
jgi:uncharacterized damage-inducible protein DinB